MGREINFLEKNLVTLAIKLNHQHSKDCYNLYCAFSNIKLAKKFDCLFTEFPISMQEVIHILISQFKIRKAKYQNEFII